MTDQIWVLARTVGRKVSALAALAGCVFLSGCWTFGESPFPEVVHVAPQAGRDVSLAVTGFAAAQIEYVSIAGWRTVYVPGYVGPYCAYAGYYETIPAQTIVSQTRPTDRYLVLARDSFEKAGYTVGAASPDWVVDVTFGGPRTTSSEAALSAAWMIGTLFFCDYSAVTWTARLRIRNNRTGKLVFSRDYDQRYEGHAFGLIPLFGIGACSENSEAYRQNWCLTALVHRVLSDATAYLSSAPVASSGH